LGWGCVCVMARDYGRARAARDPKHAPNGRTIYRSDRAKIALARLPIGGETTHTWRHAKTLDYHTIRENFSPAFRNASGAERELDHHQRRIPLLVAVALSAQARMRGETSHESLFEIVEHSTADAGTSGWTAVDANISKNLRPVRQKAKNVMKLSPASAW